MSSWTRNKTNKEPTKNWQLDWVSILLPFQREREREREHRAFQFHFLDVAQVQIILHRTN
jgi:hypothetical protein